MEIASTGTTSTYRSPRSRARMSRADAAADSGRSRTGHPDRHRAADQRRVDPAQPSRGRAARAPHRLHGRPDRSGNTTPYGEFNIVTDPEAADIVRWERVMVRDRLQSTGPPRGRVRQAIGILNLSLREPPPDGAQRSRRTGTSGLRRPEPATMTNEHRKTLQQPASAQRPPTRKPSVWVSVSGGPDVAPCEPHHGHPRQPATRTFDQLTPHSGQAIGGSIHPAKPLAEGGKAMINLCLRDPRPRPARGLTPLRTLRRELQGIQQDRGPRLESPRPLLSLGQKAANRAHAKIRARGERAIAALKPGKSWPSCVAVYVGPPRSRRPSSSCATSKPTAMQDERGSE